MTPEFLRLERISAAYGDLQVLWNVDLRVAAGELVAVLGPNGGGKSTLLRVVAGLMRPIAGQVILLGRNVTYLNAPKRVRLGVAMVPEARGLFIGMTVKENLVMGAFTRADTTEVARDLERVLTLFPDLKERLKRIAGTLSGGEQQMCAIGRALMGRPQLLLIDELSFGLAPGLAERLLVAVKGINQDGATVILVEQDVVAALGYADRGYVVSGGHVVREGPSAELLADPAIKKSYLGMG
jgi:branched-chain amino acid transport system ATP-binding protein